MYYREKYCSMVGCDSKNIVSKQYIVYQTEYGLIRTMITWCDKHCPKELSNYDFSSMELSDENYTKL